MGYGYIGYMLCYIGRGDKQSLATARLWVPIYIYNIHYMNINL